MAITILENELKKLTLEQKLALQPIISKDWAELSPLEQSIIDEMIPLSAGHAESPIPDEEPEPRYLGNKAVDEFGLPVDPFDLQSFAIQYGLKGSRQEMVEQYAQQYAKAQIDDQQEALKRWYEYNEQTGRADKKLESFIEPSMKSLKELTADRHAEIDAMVQEMESQGLPYIVEGDEK